MVENIIYRISHSSFEKYVITRGVFYFKQDPVTFFELL